MKQPGIIVTAAMNDKVRSCGASANVWLFGKSPQMPYDLLDREGQVEALQGRHPDEELRLRQYVRAQADALIAQYKIDEALRTAVNRKGRPPRLTYMSQENLWLSGATSRRRASYCGRDGTGEPSLGLTKAQKKVTKTTIGLPPTASSSWCQRSSSGQPIRHREMAHRRGGAAGLPGL